MKTGFLSLIPALSFASPVVLWESQTVSCVLGSQSALPLVTAVEHEEF